MPNEVILRGGFAGTESSADQRDIDAHQTVLSGELGESVATDNVFHVVTTLGVATLDGIDVAYGHAEDQGGGILAGGPLSLRDCDVHDNASLMYAAGVSAGSGLDATRVRFSRNAATTTGGAIRVDGDSPVLLTDTIFENNSALYGAGLFTSAKNVTITGGEFSDNVGDEGGAINVAPGATLAVDSVRFTGPNVMPMIGAAIYSMGTIVVVGSHFEHFHSSTVVSSGPADVSECTFVDSLGIGGYWQGIPCAISVTDCTFTGAGDGVNGSGLGSSGACSMHVKGSVFTDNYATDGGAAIYSNGADLVVEDSEFSNNQAGTEGGAIHVWLGSGRIERTTFRNNVAGTVGGAVFLERSNFDLIGCRFLGNSAASGGAIGVKGIWLDVESSLFVENTATYGGAVYREDPLDALTFTNTTFALNAADAGGAIDTRGGLVVKNSILWQDEPAAIFMGTGVLPTGVLDALSLSGSNLTGTYPTLTAVDPKFVDAPDDLRLQASSPCIDTALDADAPALDLEGRERRDEPGVPACGSPPCGAVADMGAYEFAE